MAKWRDYDEDDFPVTLTLRFFTATARDEFVAGLMDGWGENAVYTNYIPGPSGSYEGGDIGCEPICAHCTGLGRVGDEDCVECKGTGTIGGSKEG